MHCAELMRAQWSLMCDLPLHPPTHSPNQPPPIFPTITLPWQDLPQDHPKGLVHGTGIAICSDKDSFYLPFFTRMQLYILMNSVGLTQKIKDQALILKLGKLTSQEINPNCRPRVPGTFGNWESRQLSAHYAVGKRTKK